MCNKNCNYKKPWDCKSHREMRNSSPRLRDLHIKAFHGDKYSIDILKSCYSDSGKYKFIYRGSEIVL